MKVLICGDRNWTNRSSVLKRISILPSDTIIISGGARGADSYAAECGRQLGYIVDVFPANWNAHGKAAGPIRNRLMLDQCPDLVIAFHENIAKSKGTKDCVEEAKRRGIPVEVHNV